MAQGILVSVSCDEGASRRVPVNKLERVTHLMARMMLGLQRGRGPGTEVCARTSTLDQAGIGGPERGERVQNSREHKRVRRPVRSAAMGASRLRKRVAMGATGLEEPNSALRQ